MRAVNLIPAEHRSGASVGAGRSGGAAYAVLVIVGGLALLAFLYGRADKQISSRRAQAATLTAQAQSAQAEVAQLGPYTSFAALREQRANAVTALVDSRFDWAHVFHEFGRVLPVSVSVASLSGTIGSSGGGSGSAASAPATPASTATSSSATAPAASATAPAASGSAPAASSGPAVTSATPAGSVPTFTLTGCATSQPAVAQMLTRLRLIDGVASVTLQSSAKSTTGGSGSGGGGCQSGQAAYSVTVLFNPLPSASATQSVTAAASTATRSTPAPAGGAR